MQTQHHARTAIALVMAVFMLASLAGCVGLTQPSPTPTPTATPTATPTPSPTPAPTPEPTPEPTMEPAAALNGFHLGSGDEYGYYNSYFGFGLDKPAGWEYYDRIELNLANMIQADSGDVEAYEQEYVERLKSGLVLDDYLGYHEHANEMMMVTLRDYSESETGVLSEQEVIDFYAATFFDIGGDGTVDAKNIRSSTFMLGKTEHPMTRFEITIGDDLGYGAIMAIPKDTMYAVIILLCPEEKMLQDVIDSFYVDSKYPTIEEYSIPVIDADGYNSKFLELSFRKPAEWDYYSWDQLIYFNQLNAKKTDETALAKAYRDRLTGGYLVMEYCAFEKNLAHMAYVFSANATSNKIGYASNEDFFKTLLVYLLDFDQDMKVDIQNGVTSEENLLGEDCLVYRFDDTQGYSGVYGIVLSYRRGTTFVGIEIVSGTKGMVERILPLFTSTAGEI